MGDSMNTDVIYQKIMLEDYFNKLKNLRDRWNTSTEKQYSGLASFIDIDGEDHRQYSFIMDYCNDLIFEMLADVIKGLLKEYGIKVEYCNVIRADTDAYYVDLGNKEKYKDYVYQGNEEKILTFCRKMNDKRILFIFKRFGIGNHLPRTTLESIMKAGRIDSYHYISYVEDNAFSEVINHNNNQDDPTRGTNIYSLQFFFDLFFDKEEYVQFKKYAKVFSDRIQDYFGFALVRTLKPHAIMNFKSFLRKEIHNINAASLGIIDSVEESQIAILDQNFRDNRNYELLLGSSLFAQSYMTAEWLFTSIPKAEGIDLTSIAMGYFKSIEQFLFEYIRLHTHERDGSFRKIYCKGAMNDLTHALVNDGEMTKSLTLSSLTGFFGHFDENNCRWHKRNQDLLNRGINEVTYEYIIRSLDAILGLRNGYFHKHNLNDWDTVVMSRNTARLVYYLILGAYYFSDEEKKKLGLVISDSDDFYKLCEYINRKANEGSNLLIPIFYNDENSNPYAFVMAYHDDYIRYDNPDKPAFSGVYFKQFGKGGKIIKMDEDHIAKDIWEGTLSISKSVPITITPSGPQKHIYSDGNFLIKD